MSMVDIDVGMWHSYKHNTRTYITQRSCLTQLGGPNHNEKALIDKNNGISFFIIIIRAKQKRRHFGN